MKTILIFIFILVPNFLQARVFQQGTASWYGRENHISSTGKKINHNKPAVAHKTLPIGSKIKITSLKTKKSVIATVEDRGPFKRNRIILKTIRLDSTLCWKR